MNVQLSTVELEHRVKAPPQIVFDYFVDPDKYRRWKGVDADLDARPGGTYRVTMVPEVWVSGEYVHVERPHRIVLTWGWESEIELPVSLRQVPTASSTVEFTFTPDGDDTIIRVRHSGLPTELARRAHTLGWDSYLPRLARLLAEGDAGEDPSGALAGAYYSWDALTPD